MVVTPSPLFNAVLAVPALYNKVAAVTAEGKKVTLNVDKQPLFFEAYWCPHCQRTLVALNKNKGQLKQLPVIVSEGFLTGTTLAEAVQITHQEFAALHLSGFQVDYILNPNAGVENAKHGYPTLAFLKRRKTFTLSGEHTVSVWKLALNGEG